MGILYRACVNKTRLGLLFFFISRRQIIAVALASLLSWPHLILVLHWARLVLLTLVLFISWRLNHGRFLFLYPMDHRRFIDTYNITLNVLFIAKRFLGLLLLLCFERRSLFAGIFTDAVQFLLQVGWSLTILLPLVEWLSKAESKLLFLSLWHSCIIVLASEGYLRSTSLATDILYRRGLHEGKGSRLGRNVKIEGVSVWLIVRLLILVSTIAVHL